MHAEPFSCSGSAISGPMGTLVVGAPRYLVGAIYKRFPHDIDQHNCRRNRASRLNAGFSYRCNLIRIKAEISFKRRYVVG